MANDLKALADAAASRYGVPKHLFRRLIQQESGWNPDAHNPSGATGIVQIHLPSHPDISEEQARDPAFALGWGARYLAAQKAQFGNWRDALAAYNAGPGNVKSGKWKSFPETTNYVKTILGDGTALAPTAPALPSLPLVPAAMKPTAPTPTPAQPDTLLADIFRSNQKLIGLDTPSAVSDILAAPPPSLPKMPKSVATLATPKGKPIPVIDQTGGPLPPAAGTVVAAAQKFLGTPYSWGGGGPGGPSTGFGRGAKTKGFDCSSLLQYAYAQVGKKIPRVTYDQWKTGKSVPTNALAPGDAVFFNPGSRGPEHVGIYVGNGKFMEAPKTGDVVKISNLADRGDYMGARRW